MLASMFLAGLAMTAGSGKLAWDMLPKNKFKKLLSEAFEAAGLQIVDREHNGKRKVKKCQITYMYEEDWGWEVTVHMPPGITRSDFETGREIIESMTNSEMEIEAKGMFLHMKFYTLPLNDRVMYSDTILKECSKYSLAVVAGYSKRGMEILDFHSEGCAHLLLAGATRMGKSEFLKQLTTTLLVTKGQDVYITLINNKAVDNYPFLGISNVEIAETASRTISVLKDALTMIEQRKKKLKAKGYVNVQEYNRHEHDKIAPYFIIFDEFARFCEVEEIVDMVVEIAEIGAFADVHLIIATQRPDGREVVKPRIKDNCLTKISFKTGTKGGSITILGDEVAHQLPMIPGRGILYMNQFRTLQTPYMSNKQCLALLAPLKGAKSNDSDRPRQRSVSEFKPI